MTEISITKVSAKNAVLISEDDLSAIQETIYINSIPEMTESIIESRDEDISECTSYNPNEEW